MEGWRLLKTKHAAHAFDGEGARLYGGRWNSPGRPVIYLASNLALGVLEVLVHLEDTGPLPAYSQAQAEFDDELLETLDRASLPEDWALDPAPASTRTLGDAWLEDLRTVVLRVPSAVVHREWNYLVNPRHADFAGITFGELEPFRFDVRLHGSRS